MVAKTFLSHRYIKGATNFLFIFESWFASNRSSGDSIDVGSDTVVMSCCKLIQFSSIKTGAYTMELRDKWDNYFNELATCTCT